MCDICDLLQTTTQLCMQTMQIDMHVILFKSENNRQFHETFKMRQKKDTTVV